jgi:hypothetical protein
MWASVVKSSTTPEQQASASTSEEKSELQLPPNTGRVVILDTGPLIRGSDVRKFGNEFVTTPQVGCLPSFQNPHMHKAQARKC